MEKKKKRYCDSVERRYGMQNEQGRFSHSERKWQGNEKYRSKNLISMPVDLRRAVKVLDLG